MIDIPNEPFNITSHIDTNKTNTMLVRVNGDQYNDYYLNDGDILFVDVASPLKDNTRCLVSLNDNLSIKLYREIDSKPYLRTNDNHYLPLQIGPDVEFQIIGSIIGSISEAYV